MKPMNAYAPPVVLMNATKWDLSQETSPIKNENTIEGRCRESSIQTSSEFVLSDDGVAFSGAARKLDF